MPELVMTLAWRAVGVYGEATASSTRNFGVEEESWLVKVLEGGLGSGTTGLCLFVPSALDLEATR
jgi:hypothetical protein